MTRRRRMVKHTRCLGMVVACLGCVVSGNFCASAAQNTGWRVAVEHYGEEQGETTVNVAFPSPARHMPVTFGIPVGQAASPSLVRVLDAGGDSVTADVTPLMDWDHSGVRWAIISCVLNGAEGHDRVPLTIHWGDSGTTVESSLQVDVYGDIVNVVNDDYRLTLTARGIEALQYGGVDLNFESWRPTFTVRGGEKLSPLTGKFVWLHKGPICQSFRFVSHLMDNLELHQEYDFYAGSPFIRCRMRFVNRSVEDIPVGQIVPIEIDEPDDMEDMKAGLSEDGEVIQVEDAMSIVQGAFGWRARFDKQEAEGTEDTLGEWFALAPRGADQSLLLVFPHFQEMAAGESTALSEMAFRDGKVLVRHFAARPGQTPDIRLRETMARTFEYWIVAGVEAGHETAVAAAVKQRPYAVYDRAYLTAMGVFPERRVSHLFDDEVLQAALYFKRAQVPRAEYPRCSRGGDPELDKSGEGTYEVDLHAGGMVYGEVYQYFEPRMRESVLTRYHDEIGVPLEHIVTGGENTYRNGDIVLALYQQYLRTGDPVLAQFAPIHASVFADVSVSHAPISNGLGHYYCDWYGQPYVYQRFEGLLLAALVTGDPWWMETAIAMADYCVTAWQDGEPRDGKMAGGFHGAQLRSPYIAKMLLKLHALTGEQRYADTAVRLAEWLMPMQESEGWWRDTPHVTREYRNSPIFAAYACMGLWPLYHSTGNERLRTTLIKAVEYQVSMQRDTTGNNPGTFPNSYWYRLDEGGDATTPIPKHIVFDGNYAVTSHWADIIFQAYLETGNLDYFYSANAAWANVINHRTAEGGVPLSNGRNGSVWGHVMVECLPHFAAIAEERGLPIVLGSWEEAELDCFVGKGATCRNGIFSFGMKYRHPKPLPVRVYFPAGMPVSAAVDGVRTAFDYDPARSVATLQLRPAQEYRVVRIALTAAGALP